MLKKYTKQAYPLILDTLVNRRHNSLMDTFIFKNSTFSTSLSTSHMDNFACGHDQYGALIPRKYSIYPYLAACGIGTTRSDFIMHAI